MGKGRRTSSIGLSSSASETERSPMRNMVSLF
jgi:hypothetical protein